MDFRPTSTLPLCPRHSSLPLLWLLLAFPAVAHERNSFPVVGADENQTVTVPTAETPPTIDGKLEAGEWASAAKLGGFRCLLPQHGATPTYDTTVYLLGTPGHLYLAFECQMGNPADLEMSETREDASLSGQDRVTILLDTLHDHRRSIELSVSARGTKHDERWGNDEWDAVWTVAAGVYEKSYVIEIDLVLGSLTYERSGAQTIGMNLLRFIEHPDEDTAWAVDERTTPWNLDERKFPHLVGLVFPEAPAEQKVRVDAFAVLVNDWEPDGGVRSNQGLDIEYPLTTSVTSRYVLFPDFSDVEAVYQSIDVAYREEFLPDNRDFFVRQREFFGSSSLFHSRRIADFDYGAKIVGALDEYRIGVLDAYNPDDHRNHLVTHVRRAIGYQSNASFSVVDVRDAEFHNTSFDVGFSTHFKEDSPWRAELGYASSVSSDLARVGHATSAELAFSERQLGSSLEYSEVSPNFDPIDGYNPRRGYRSLELDGWREWESRPGRHFYDRFELFGRYAYGETTDGRFYRRSVRGGMVVRFDTRSRILIIPERDLHLEEQIRPEPFDDRFTTIRGEWGNGKGLSAQGSYRFGRVEDSNLRQFGASLDWRNSSGSLSAGVDYGRRLQEFYDGSVERADVFEVSLTHVLDPEHWLSLRWYRRIGDADINNLSLVYRMHKNSGKELFLILGDPQADQPRRKIALKYVHPFTF